MPSVATTTSRRSSRGSRMSRRSLQDEGTQSQDWPEDASDRHSHASDRKQFHGDGLNTGVRVLSDGRLDIKINQHRPSIAGLLNQIQRTPIPSELEELQDQESSDEIPKNAGKDFPLHLNIVIQVIGSRGDIQPFIALGKELQAYGHRVRLATHLAFRDFVLDGGLEFFDIGGDPAELMAFMVKNPGLLPNVSTIRSGAIQKRRREMKQIINGCWKSCFETGDGTDLHQIKEDLWSDKVDYRRRPFVADVIIANPPSLAHIHCAQRLGIPLHIMFTMPWSPTQAFPHPLATIHHNGCQPTVANFVSYAIMEMMVWEGLGDIVNKFRKKVLSLDPLDSITAPSLLPRLRIPFSYLWSPAILPKPKDWGKHIDICGFAFLPAKPDFTPPSEVEEFLKAGPPPIYVGFGSIVVDDPIRLTEIVYGAIRQSGQRAIVSKGWGNLGAEEVKVPDNILMIGSVPHDWLFRQVSCVIHHGGAGTTAAGLSLGRPTIVIPFFGDQQFWGEILTVVGAGFAIPHKQLTVDKLDDAIRKALDGSTQEKAKEISKKMQDESGVRDGVCSFHRHLDLKALRCVICPTRPAVWHIKHTGVGISAFAATVLVEMGKVKPEDLVLNRPVEYDTYRDPVGPLSASAQVLFGAITNFVTGLADVPAEMIMDLVSAGRALGHPNEHYDPHSKWHRRKHRHEHTSSDGDDRTRRIEEPRNIHQGQNQAQNRGSEEFWEDNDEELTTFSSDVNETNMADTGLSRTRTLQLENSQSMSDEAFEPKRHGVFSEAASQGSRMSKKLINLIIWLPTDLTLSLSKGFHNAPKLYHDPMVRATPKVIGIRSGFRAAKKVKNTVLLPSDSMMRTLTARKEFYDGFYYGITGLVTQPRHAYRKTGAKGIAKGVGKGVGGVLLKPPAGLWGLAGYPLTGIRRKLLTSLGKTQEGKILVSRISQGHDEMRASSAGDRSEVVRKWVVIEKTLHQTASRPCGKPCGSRSNKHTS
ncbi:hypothetical protein N7532_009986 [Penicillium argentinense]|uniref:Glycosyltransferase family 28 N-terminal domain-containing protein n=1 Tax=Penicillium argentinense TaxID=1131581 RepID=A0A9W9JXL2_9EURO|nr:uncharacterized protein N7532_009986 [Penicillium argentinense]KAJ5085215.1 hypothetical protein N7532_009986 [Penicillium argentinense]